MVHHAKSVSFQVQPLANRTADKLVSGALSHCAQVVAAYHTGVQANRSVTPLGLGFAVCVLLPRASLAKFYF